MGEGAWPPNRGFVKATKDTLEPGSLVDRYGGWIDEKRFHDGGSFISHLGSSFD